MIHRLDRNLLHVLRGETLNVMRERLTTGPGTPLGPSSPYDMNKAGRETEEF